jgi:hypothetical protein
MYIFQLLQNSARIFLLLLRAGSVGTAQIAITVTRLDVGTAGHLVTPILEAGHIFDAPKYFKSTGDATFLIDADGAR